MLTQLTISGFAIVDTLDLEFRDGMSVITGETGAGKSIMLDALSLTLGDRAESGQIGAGRSKAEIATQFDVRENKEARDWLARQDLSSDDHQCLLRRVLTADGRSRAYINGSPATLQDLKTLGNMLVDVHSQHEHQSLLKRETQCRLLDEYGSLTADIAHINATHEEYRKLQIELRSLLGDNIDQSARLQLLSYQVDELDTAAIAADEHKQLEAEHKRLINAEQSLEKVSTALNLISEGELNSKDMLTQAIAQLQTIDDEALRPLTELLSSGLIQIEEAAADLRHEMGNWEIDPGRLGTVETRLGQIYEITRKHRVSPEALPALEAELREELDKLNHLDDHVKEIEARLQVLKKTYATQAASLHKQRSATASKLQKQVENQLTLLGMKDARFVIEVIADASGEPRINGLDQVNFLISTNPGNQPGPLNRIASGGELSRISLAIQVVTAHTSMVPSLIFDEVDVGVGGATAEIVGQLLRQLGEKSQIICVTHLPQVAAQGHHHFRVSKENAQTRIEELAENNKVAEIARMLGGVNMTDQSMAHAEEMFKTAQQH